MRRCKAASAEALFLCFCLKSSCPGGSRGAWEMQIPGPLPGTKGLAISISARRFFFFPVQPGVRAAVGGGDSQPWRVGGAGSFVHCLVHSIWNSTWSEDVLKKHLVTE